MNYINFDKYTMTICPCCKKLFVSDIKEPIKATLFLIKKAKKHWRYSQECKYYMDNLPKASELMGILKEEELLSELPISDSEVSNKLK